MEKNGSNLENIKKFFCDIANKILPKLKGIKKLSKINTVTAAFAVVAAIAITFNITAVMVTRHYNTGLDISQYKGDLYSKMTQVINIYKSEYIGGDPDWQTMKDYALYGFVSGSGDKYSMYLDKENYKLYSTSNSGELVGIGVSVVHDSDTDGMKVVDVFANSPASSAGILIGDMIVGVNGEDVSKLGYYNATSKMLGEANTKLNLSIYRNDKIIDLTLTRAVVQVNPVESKSLGDGIIYVKISEFNQKTFSEFQSVINKYINDESTKGFVFDVRNDPGGELSSIVSTLDMLLGEGKIVDLVDKKGNKETYTSDASQVDLPMSVIVNAQTASAAELFAAALQDTKKADIVGVKTYGKGTELKVIELDDGSAVIVSDRYYYTPSGRNLEGTGVTPDYEVKLTEDQMSHYYELSQSDDAQLQKAIECVKSKIK